jgi:hypothetical protein
MAKSIRTSFTFRLADKSITKLVADKQVANSLSGKNFYSTTYQVDEVGKYLGNVPEFLAVHCKTPILICFQRVDMLAPTEIYCSNLFINHGDFGQVWLKVPPGVEQSIVTVWYSTDASVILEDEAITVYTAEVAVPKSLRLRNLDGFQLGIPILSKDRIFVNLNKVDGCIQTFTHNGEIKSLSISKVT